jgi:hypothetical protein
MGNIFKEAGKGPGEVPGFNRKKYTESSVWCDCGRLKPCKTCDMICINNNCDNQKEQGSVFCEQCNQQLPEKVEE